MYTQNIDGCFGRDRLAKADFDAVLAGTAPALSRLRMQHGDGSLPLLRLPGARDDLEACEKLAGHLLKDASDLVLLGTGGSSLGAQALAQIVDKFRPIGGARNGDPRFHFLDNLDPLAMDAVIGQLDLRHTRFLVISKSGNTAETLSQALCVIAAYEAAGAGKTLKHHFGMITEPGNRATRRLAAQYDIPTVDHPPGVGGRYSVLSSVGMVPAYYLGLDGAAVREGAAVVLAPVLAGAPPADVPAAIGATLCIACENRLGARIQIVMPYGDRLERLAMWHRQLWAESLGKNGKGTTPVAALGPVDQHSQLQLYLGGPRDKLYTVLTQALAGKGPRIASADPELAYLNGRTIGDLADAEQRATIDTLVANTRPTRTLHVPVLDAHTLGGLFMHFMLETIIAAYIMGVDPFDQPAVEEGKVLSRKYLLDMKE
ncbi:MAG: glucose-6-phosphate isomerase [Alphaproteobacteria bacterium]|nr:glucose-6-phosphate isomerase [Alphaproteobacteria bacterium]